MAKLLSGALAASAAAAVAAAEHQPYMYTVTGACDVEGGLDGQTFLRQGFTLSGAPWYKAIDTDMYMYWDSDCMGSTDGTPRWIIDTDKPSLTAEKDLDGDRFCDYVARIDSPDIKHPPIQGTWTMQCAGKFEPQYLILLEGTTTSTRPPTTKTTTAAPGAITTKARSTSEGEVLVTTTTEEASAPLGHAVTLVGACALKSFLNGLLFEEAGMTNDGRPFYKARDREEYLYYDADCDGAGESQASRWVLDRSRPSLTAEQDLDEDGKCDYHARLDSTDMTPPAAATWRMYCGAAAGGWVDTEVVFRKSSSVQPVAVETTTTKDGMVSASPRAAPAAAAALLAGVLAWALGA